MKPTASLRVLLVLAGALLLGPAALAAAKSLTVSVRSSVAAGYERSKLPGGGYKPERYVIANGGMLAGTRRDTSFDKVSYPEVAGIVARHLAANRYFLAQKPQDADLLIAIYWGETIPFNDTNYNFAVDNLARAQAGAGGAPTLGQRMNGPSQPESFALADSTDDMEFGLALLEMRNRERDSLNTLNARLLGHVDAINDRRDMLPWVDIGDVQAALISDVEEDRYYVVVRAYDFKAMQRNDPKALRWVTRISIGARGTSFDERFTQMIAAAADSFGRQHPLHRRFYADPRVDLGELKFFGEAGAPERPH